MKDSRITIGRLTSFSPKDAEAVKRLAAQLGANFQPLRDQDLKDMLASATTSLFVARESEGQEIVGMITLAVYRIPYVKKAYLDDVIVDESFRGQGLGSQLLKRALAQAKELGASYADLTSHPTRIESNKLYEKFGFKKRDTNVYRLDFDYDKA